ncbi:hypothetical protein ACIQNU_04795 [Streptomyces sp. NPDC091292]|uniref:hypothetical protein n=1 Tax=Streptomyces sp. NPDC091292 TaxID=3365991 RepID=UPI003828CF14
MGRWNRKSSDAEVTRQRDADLNAARRARNWGMASASTWESSAAEADAELIRRGEQRLSNAAREVAACAIAAEASRLDGHGATPPEYMARRAARAVNEARKSGWSDAAIRATSEQHRF